MSLKTAVTRFAVAGKPMGRGAPSELRERPSIEPLVQADLVTELALFSRHAGGLPENGIERPACRGVRAALESAGLSIALQ